MANLGGFGGRRSDQKHAFLGPLSALNARTRKRLTLALGGGQNIILLGVFPVCFHGFMVHRIAAAGKAKGLAGKRPAEQPGAGLLVRRGMLVLKLGSFEFRVG